LTIAWIFVACHMTTREIGRRKKGATLKFWPGMRMTWAFSAHARATAARRSALDLVDPPESSTSLAHALDEHEIGGADLAALQLLDDMPDAGARPGDIHDRVRAGNAAASLPAVDSAGKAPTPNAVLSPAMTMVLQQCWGHDWAGTVCATRRRENLIREA
jgi:hypothetical protein